MRPAAGALSSGRGAGASVALRHGRAVRRRLDRGRRYPHDLRVALVVALRDLLVLVGHRLDVDVGVAEDVHLLVALADLRSPEADVLDDGHDAAEERRAV